MLKKLGFIGGVLVLVGCSPTIDGSDHDAFKDSMEEITRDMDSSETYKFVVAAATACPLTLQAGQPTFVDESCLPLLDGKTVDEVNEMAQINRLKLRLRTAEDQLEISQGLYAHTPASPEKAARYGAEVAEIREELNALGAE